jgi:ABC-type transport system involved in multi-copper enzyme maturation permease subunit
VSDILNPQRSARPARTTSPVYWICRGVFIESARRREISVVLLFMALFGIGAVAARFVGSENYAAAAFILNLGLSLAWFMTLLLAILLGGRQFPDELESRSLYPLLAKPLGRHQYVMGKWVATCLVCLATLIILNGIALLASPWPKGLSAGTLIQGLVLEIIAVAAVAALTIMFSIRLPKSLAIVISGLLVFGAAPVVSMILSRYAPGNGLHVAEWVTGYIPNIGRLDLLNAFSGGAPPITWWDFAARLLYGALIALFSLGLATALLERRTL